MNDANPNNLTVTGSVKVCHTSTIGLLKAGSVEACEIFTRNIPVPEPIFASVYEFLGQSGYFGDISDTFMDMFGFSDPVSGNTPQQTAWIFQPLNNLTHLAMLVHKSSGVGSGTTDLTFTVWEPDGITPIGGTGSAVNRSTEVDLSLAGSSGIMVYEFDELLLSGTPFVIQMKPLYNVPSVNYRVHAYGITSGIESGMEP